MRHPSVPPAIALLAGAAIGCHWGVPVWASTSVMAAAWILSALLLRAIKSPPAMMSTRLFAFFALLGFLAAGVALGAHAEWTATHTSLRSALIEARGGGDLSNEPAGIVRLTGELTEDAMPSTSGGFRLVLDTSILEVANRRFDVEGGVTLTVMGSADSATASAWRRGRTITISAQLRRPAKYLNAGVPDFELASERRGITLVGSAKSPMVVDLIARGTLAEEVAGELRAKARSVLDAVVGRWDKRSAAVARAVILGDRSGLDEETEERLQRAGTYHVIAISGGNIAILAGLLFFVLRATISAAGIVEVVVAGCLIGYAFLVGGGASVNRATLMAVMVLLAHAADARGRPLNALGCAAGLSLAADPLIIYDAGAWLTYGATLAIMVGGPLVMNALPTLISPLRAVIALFVASLSAELALFPIAAFVFSRVTAAGLVLNFAAIPLMTVVQVAGMVVLGIAWALPFLADLVGRVTHLAAWGLVESARVVDAMPWVTTRVPPPEPWIVAIYYAAWILWFGLRTAGRPKTGVPGSRPSPIAAARLATVALLAATGLWIISAPAVRASTAGRLSVTFVDVGQGDSTLIRFPTGETWLVDAGGATSSRFDIARRVIEPAIWARGVRQLDQLLLTHGDADHIGGAPSMLRDLEPGIVWEGTPVPKHQPLTDLRDLATSRGAMWRQVRRGDRVSIGRVEVTVWNPGAADWERQRVRNDDSIVIGLRLGNALVVLPGDIEAATEAELAAIFERAPLTIVQAPHHGSKSSSSTQWLLATKPSAVVMSVGRNNRFGHPGSATLQRYRDAGAAVFRTDQDGAISIVTDGQELSISTFTGRSLTIPAGTPGGLPPS